MTAERAEAYGRIVALVDGSDELSKVERDQLRDAADALLFAGGAGPETHEALCEARAVAYALVASSRWSVRSSHELLTALRGCGPEGLPAWPVPLPEARLTAAFPGTRAAEAAVGARGAVAGAFVQASEGCRRLSIGSARRAGVHPGAIRLPGLPDQLGGAAAS